MTITQHTVSNLLKNIYVLEQDKIPSVFLEFDSTQVREMVHACKNASKSWELCQDKRVPTQANEKFCFGFTVNANEIDNANIKSTDDLIDRAVYWLRDDWSHGVLKVDPNTRIFIEASDLMKSTKTMPTKNYNKIYEIDGNLCAPVHIVKGTPLR